MPEVPIKIKMIPEESHYTHEEMRMKLIQSVLNVRGAHKMETEEIISEAQKLFDWVIKQTSSK